MYKSSLLLLSIILCVKLFATEKPNILWIVTDDQRADALECYNRATIGTSESPLGYVSSPAIDKLAAEGVLFTQAYCNSPACAPSRGSMHRGQYPHHAGIYGFELTHSEPDFTKPTIPENMSKAGYHTMKIGKSGYYIFQWRDGKIGYTEANFYDKMIDMKNDLQKSGNADFYKRVSWGSDGKIGTEEVWYKEDGTETSYFVERTGADLTQEDIDSKKATYEKHEVLTSYTRSNPDLILGGFSSQPTMETLDGTITQSLITYLENPNKYFKTLNGTTMQGPQTDEPQFFYLGYHFPHTPVLPSKSFRDKFNNKTYQVPEFNKSELEKLPTQLVTWYEKMKVDEMSAEEKQQMIRDYYAFCAMGDSLIGLAVESFKNYNEKHNQEYLIVLATGDHGWHLGEQGISAKFGPFLQSTHTAVVVSGSDKSKYPDGKVCSDFIEYVDFASTFYAEAGLDIKSEDYAYLDGYNLSEVVNKQVSARDYILGEMNHVMGPRAYLRAKDFAFSMRTRKKNNKPSASYLPNNDITWALTTSAKNAEMALYDLRVDPKEQNNVAYDANYTELADWFRKKLGKIVLGDGRVECAWNEESLYDISNFAPGSDDKKLDIPTELVPQVAMVQDINALKSLSVFPNPSSNTFSAKSNSGIAQELQVFNGNGQVIEKLMVEKAIDFGSAYPSGTYYLRIPNTNENGIVVKF